jgi:hypothetical protein
MALPAPILDSRTFDDLVREARARIPRFTPEWTNLNDSDPGMTLVKLHAWLTETILYELNRVPELHYVKFLDLLGIAPTPARPARTELVVTLDKLGAPNDPLTVPVPLHTKVAVDDPDLPREVVFETDRTLVALNAHVGAVFAHSAEAGRTRALVTRYDGETAWLHAFAPLDPQLTVGAGLYLGLLLRPHASGSPAQHVDDRLPAGPLDLYVDAVQVLDRGPDGAVVEGPLGAQCPAPDEAAAAQRQLVWQIYTGDSAGSDHFGDDSDDTGWTDLALAGDETGELQRSGHLVLELPAGATALRPTRLAPQFWAAFGQPRPPQTTAELLAALHELPGILPGLGDRWAQMGVDDPDDLAAFAACDESVDDTVAKIQSLPADTLHPDRLTFADWVDVEPGFAVDLPESDGELRPLYWLRVRVAAPYPDGAPGPAALRAVHLNVVAATQAATRLDDNLGRSTGRPAQVFTLPRAPVLIDPATDQPVLTLRIGDETWQRVGDFQSAGPADPHYLLDPTTGTITLGDGERGRIPVAGAEVVAARFRTGGGEIGNVPAGTVSRIKGRIRHVKGVTNLRAANGGTEAETLEAVQLRAPHVLRVRDRAMSAQDFADLALRAPGAALHTAYALARRALAPDQSLVERDGAVTLVVLPRSQRPAPQPTEAELRAVCRFLEPRRLVTTELHVTGPRYTTVERLGARLTVRAGHDLTAVTSAAQDALVRFLHPIRGGADGVGWAFGEDVFHGDLYDVLLGVEGVRRVRDLTVRLAGAQPTAGDVTVLAEGHLPALSPAAVDLVSSYD